MEKLSTKEGTITFWIKERSVNFSDSSVVRLFSVDPEGGSILMLKDADACLKAFFVVLGKGRIDLVFDCSELDGNVAHFIAFTWSIEELNLYVDGEKKVSKEVKF